MHELVEGYSKIALGFLGEVPFDKKHGAVLTFADGQITVHFEPGKLENTAYVYTFLEKIPSENREKLYGLLLASHLFGHITNEAYFGLDNENQRIVLFKTCKMDGLEQNEFNTLVNEFIEATLVWKEAMQKFMHAGESSLASHRGHPIVSGI